MKMMGMAEKKTKKEIKIEQKKNPFGYPPLPTVYNMKAYFSSTWGDRKQAKPSLMGEGTKLMEQKKCIVGCDAGN